jgi:hypothetical protein
MTLTIVPEILIPQLYYKLFGVADYEFDGRKFLTLIGNEFLQVPLIGLQTGGPSGLPISILFIKFKMANPKWRTYLKKISYCNEKFYKKVFGISNHEFLLCLNFELLLSSRCNQHSNINWNRFY